MPLHLLGKKSWNVYNSKNIARVRRDEAQAKAHEEEQERRMQEVDAERRINILRCQSAGTPPPAPVSESDADLHRRYGREKKRRRIAGEDDTDRDIRYAREDAERAPKHDDAVWKPSSGEPLTDHTGHISLFPPEKSRRTTEKNVEAEAEAAKKKREYEDQYTMRFSNAAGFKQSMENPWYSSASAPGPPEEQVGKNVWGNEDPMRREREKARTDADDPLVAMTTGVTQLRKAEQDRKKWKEEREKELAALKLAGKGRGRRRRRHDSPDELEDFRLDESPNEKKLRHRQHNSHRHHHRSRSGERRRQHTKQPGDRDSRQKGHDQASAADVPGWMNAPGKRYSAQFATL